MNSLLNRKELEQTLGHTKLTLQELEDAMFVGEAVRAKTLKAVGEWLEEELIKPPNTLSGRIGKLHDALIKGEFPE